MSGLDRGQGDCGLEQLNMTSEPSNRDTGFEGDNEDDEETEDDNDLDEQQVQRLAALYKGPSVPNEFPPAAATDSSVQHKPQEDESGTDTDEDGQLIQKAKVLKENMERAKQQPKPKKPQTPKPPGVRAQRGGISLLLLMEEGLLEPGKDVMVVEYKGQTAYGELTREGKILYDGKTHETPSSYSITVKRKLCPTRKADDGWKTVKYMGKFLEHYKTELARKRFPDGAPAELLSNVVKRPKVESSSSARPIQPSKASEQSRKPFSPFKSDVKGNGSAASSYTGATQKEGPPEGSAVARPKRQTRPMQYATLGDDHQMVPCESYRGEPGSGQRGAQPFKVVVSPLVNLVMDYHAHLSYNEVIGLLGGIWSEQDRVLRVERAFPVLELQTEDNSINAEMDPEDEYRVRNHIANDYGMRCIGWYHSHPMFETMPSLIDIYNQVVQQHHHQDNDWEPYIAAIVGPYDNKLPTADSSLLWWYVEHPKGQIPKDGQSPLDAGCTPKQLTVEPDPEAVKAQPELQSTQLQSLAKRYAIMKGRPEMDQPWREGVQRVDKLQESLRGRLPEHWDEHVKRKIVQRVDAIVMAAWNVFKPKA